MRESQKTLLTPKYVWEEFKTAKGYTYGNMPTYVALPLSALMFLVCLFCILLYDFSIVSTLIFLFSTVLVVTLSVILTRTICKRKVIALNNKPIPEIVFEKDVCVDKKSHYDTDGAGVESWTFYFEKAGKIGNYRKYGLTPSIVDVGDLFYTARFSFNGKQMKFYPAKSYRLFDLTAEELAAENTMYCEEEHKLLTTMLALDTQCDLQIRSANPSWSNDNRFWVSVESESIFVSPLRRFALERFDGDLVSATECILRYADDDFKNQLADHLDATEAFLLLATSKELAKKCYKNQPK